MLGFLGYHLDVNPLDLHLGLHHHRYFTSINQEARLTWTWLIETAIAAQREERKTVNRTTRVTERGMSCRRRGAWEADRMNERGMRREKEVALCVLPIFHSRRRSERRGL